VAGATRSGRGRNGRGFGLGFMPERLTPPALSAAEYLRHQVRLRGLEPHESGGQVIDEPFASLDAQARETLWRLVAKRAHDGAAVMFCDHHEWSGRARGPAARSA